MNLKLIDVLEQYVTKMKAASIAKIRNTTVDIIFGKMLWASTDGVCTLTSTIILPEVGLRIVMATGSGRDFILDQTTQSFTYGDEGVIAGLVDEIFAILENHCESDIFTLSNGIFQYNKVAA